jgi:hypothetical protein
LDTCGYTKYLRYSKPASKPEFNLEGPEWLRERFRGLDETLKSKLLRWGQAIDDTSNLEPALRDSTRREMSLEIFGREI